MFNLRKGVKFTNGKELSAEDAIYSLNYHRGADSKSGGKASVAAIDDIQKLDKYQVKVVLNCGDADFLYSLTDYHMLVVPDGFKDWANPVGTGAFHLEKFDPGVRISLKKNPDFYKENRGFLDAAEITIINDAVARVNALKSGQIDAINRVDPKAAAAGREERQPQARARARRLARVSPRWRSTSAPLQQPRLPAGAQIRHQPRADPQGAVLGYGSLGNDHPVPRTDPYFNSELAQRTYDPEKAAFYAKKAGITTPASCCRLPTPPSTAPSTWAS